MSAAETFSSEGKGWKRKSRGARIGGLPAKRAETTSYRYEGCHLPQAEHGDVDYPPYNEVGDQQRRGPARMQRFPGAKEQTRADAAANGNHLHLAIGQGAVELVLPLERRNRGRRRLIARERPFLRRDGRKGRIGWGGNAALFCRIVAGVRGIGVTRHRGALQRKWRRGRRLQSNEQE